MLNLQIKTGGAAFCDADGNEDRTSEAIETARILREIAADIEANPEKLSGSKNDINGNKVATWEKN